MVQHGIEGLLDVKTPPTHLYRHFELSTWTMIKLAIRTGIFWTSKDCTGSSPLRISILELVW